MAPRKTGFNALPDEIIEKILSSFSYDEISRLRQVCKKFDKCCQRLLNQGFLKVERFHAVCLRNVKTQLPRRESERRKHPLSRHCDILTAIETRLSLLGMTFMKYVDMNLCCFIPGKVIDEIYKVLNSISNSQTPPRPHEILQELRDISSMAMEHFDEKIVPGLKQKIGAPENSLSVTSQGTYTVAALSSSLHCPPRGMVRHAGYKHEILKLQLHIKQCINGNITLKKEVADLKLKSCEEKKKQKEFDKQISEQNRIISEQNSRIAEQERKINELNRKLLDYDRHIVDIMAELSHSQEESSHSVQSNFQTTIAKGVAGPSKTSPSGMKHSKDPTQFKEKVLRQKRSPDSLSIDATLCTKRQKKKKKKNT